MANRNRHDLLPGHWIANAISARVFRLLWGRRFHSFGPGVNVLRPEGIEGARFISLHAGALVGARSYLGTKQLRAAHEPELVIGSHARIGRYNHIYATKSIRIEERVLTANNVYIADNTHRFDNPDLPVVDQPIEQLGTVRIGAGSWIGHGACIIGAKLGENSVVGAGAVVLQDFPDRCVVVGAPARIARRYDPVTMRWRRTTADGIFDDDGS